MAVVLGGGITGLVAAYELSKKGFDVTLIEKDHVLGGALGSAHLRVYEIEKFYHHVFTSDKEFMKLCGELGIADKIIWKMTKTGFYSGGKIYDLSGAIDLLMFPLLSPADRMRLAVFAMKLKTMAEKQISAMDGVSAKAWIEKNLGKDAYENFFEPMLASKYGKRLGDVSAAWFIERMRMRSSRGLRGEKLGYMEGGFSKLVQRLHAEINENGGKIIIGAGAKKIILKNNGVEAVSTGKIKLKTRCVISTIPPKELLRLCAFRGEYWKSFGNLAYQGCISVLMGIDKSLTDYYWTNLIDKNDVFGAIVEHTNFISPEKYSGDRILYLASYPSLDSCIWKKNDSEIFRIYFSQLRKIFPEKRIKPFWHRVFRTRDAGLVYRKGILSEIPLIKTPARGMFVGGMFNSYPERGINNSISIGKECARLAAET